MPNWTKKRVIFTKMNYSEEEEEEEEEVGEGIKFSRLPFFFRLLSKVLLAQRRMSSLLPKMTSSMYPPITKATDCKVSSRARYVDTTSVVIVLIYISTNKERYRTGRSKATLVGTNLYHSHISSYFYLNRTGQVSQGQD